MHRWPMLMLVLRCFALFAAFHHSQLGQLTCVLLLSCSVSTNGVHLDRCVTGPGTHTNSHAHTHVPLSPSPPPSNLPPPLRPARRSWSFRPTSRARNSPLAGSPFLPGWSRMGLTCWRSMPAHTSFTGTTTQVRCCKGGWLGCRDEERVSLRFSLGCLG